VSYEWHKDNRAIANGGAPLRAKGIGEYRCLQIGHNAAGSTSQASEPIAVFSLGMAKLDKRTGTATLRVKVPDPGKLILHGKGVDQRKMALGKRKHGGGKLTVRLHGKRVRKLDAKGTLKVKVRVSYKANGAPLDSQTKTLKLKKAG